jgi:site-specific DNA-methyltransferase (adenine-specific)
MNLLINDDTFSDNTYEKVIEYCNLKSKGIKLILADMPYGTTNCKWDTDINLEALWSFYDKISSPNTVIALFSQTPFDKILGASNIKNLKYEWIWEKTQGTGHLNAKKCPMKCHENILIFYKKQPIYNPIKTYGHKLKVSSRAHKLNTLSNQSPIYNKSDNFSDYSSTERYPRSVLKFPSDKQKISLHPTQKPVAILEYFIKTYTNEGDIVMDNFMGSGSTGIACLNTKRDFIGIEMDMNYFNIANERIKNH